MILEINHDVLFSWERWGVLETSLDKDILYPQINGVKVQIPTSSGIKTKKSCFYDKRQDKKFIEFLKSSNLDN